jgi:FHA domain
VSGIRIRLVSGPAAGRSLDVDGELVIGRGGEGLAIDDPELSRRHVAVRPAGDGVVVEDLGSTNGTFVAGERITSPVTIANGGSFQAGKSEIAVEAEVAGATKLHEAPDPVATRLSASPPPAPSPPSPPPAPAAPPSAPPPAGAAPPPSPARTPPAPPEPTAAPSPRPARPPWLPAALGAAALAVLILVIALATGGDDGAKSHRLSAPVNATILSNSPTHTVFAGVLSGTPVDIGNATLDITRARSLKGVGQSPVAITGRLVIRSDDGAADATFRGTVKPQPDSSLRYAGTGSFSGGTGELDGAKGRFTLAGTQAGGSPKARFTLRGTLEY